MSCHPPDTEPSGPSTIDILDQNVCLVGMPNAGKTTLMNALTGGNFKTANYPGVTVSLLRGRTQTGIWRLRATSSTCRECTASSHLRRKRNWPAR